MQREKEAKTQVHRRIGAAYVRVSTEEQIEYSPDSQIRKIREYAMHHSICLPDEFIFQDEGISGRSAKKRPAFMQMIGIARQKPRPFDVILVWKFSRFARNRQDSILYKSMLRKECGIDVISITEQLSDDPTAILIEALLEAMDEYYSINLAQEVKRGMNEKFSRGGVVSVPPFGYRMGTEFFEPEEEKAAIVRLIFQEFASGASYRSIAEKLNEMGIRTNRGNLFESRAIEYILSNPVYLGKLRRNKSGADRTDRFYRGEDVELVQAAHKPIVTEELFYAVQNRINRMAQFPLKQELNKGIPQSQCEPNPIKGMKQAQSDQGSIESMNQSEKNQSWEMRERRRSGTRCSVGEKPLMLYGLVRCSSCGSTLTRTADGKALQCHRYAKGTCKVSHYISLKKLNPAVLKQVQRDLGSGMLELTVLEKEREKKEDISQILLVREQRRLERVKAAYEEGIDSLEEYRKNKAEIEVRLKHLIQEAEIREGEREAERKAENIVPVKISLNSLIALFDTSKTCKSSKQEQSTPYVQIKIGEAEQNRFLSSIISHIVYFPTDKMIRIYYRTEEFTHSSDSVKICSSTLIRS